jgi:hypothetical protein
LNRNTPSLYLLISQTHKHILNYASLAIPTGKILACPFNTEVKPKLKQSDLAREIMAAVKEITGSQGVSVATPNKARNATPGTKPPMTFLIHNLTTNEVSHLASCTIWAKGDLAFQVAHIPPDRPTFLFTIEGLITESTTHVQELVLETWKNPTSTKFLNEVLDQIPEAEQTCTKGKIQNFINSIQVHRLDYKAMGGKADPHFNVYAEGSLIVSVDTWLEVRNYFCNCKYESTLFGKGSPRADKFYCTICHGKDHLRGMCPFLKIPG